MTYEQTLKIVKDCLDTVNASRLFPGIAQALKASSDEQMKYFYLKSKGINIKRVHELIQKCAALSFESYSDVLLNYYNATYLREQKPDITNAVIYSRILLPIIKARYDNYKKVRKWRMF